jgi:acyl-CoA-binding protein
MNELEFNQLIELLEDSFEGDYTITRTGLLELLNKAKWNAKIRIKDELEALKEKNTCCNHDCNEGRDCPERK